MNKYHYAHVSPDHMASGEPIEFGQVVELDEKALAHAHNKWLVSEGRLVLVPQPTAKSMKPSSKENPN